MLSTNYIQCYKCEKEAFLPTGEYRPANKEYYLLMEEGKHGKQTKFAFFHIDKMPKECPVVILKRLLPCCTL